ncbi:EF-hand domain-containing protein D1-like [Amphiura filiformis]|uniref:EF-hand domain-containing protein D1-like n=1 Tax=Amphiura filiformis TaxID=82378 RepID=UPI003B21D04F
MGDDELSGMLSRRMDAEEGKITEKRMKEYVDPRDEFAHPYPEFSEFTREQCKSYEEMFAQVDTDIDGFIDYNELKMMMESRGEPLTHLELTKLIKEVDEDKDGKLCFREFMLIWQKCMKGEIPEGSGFAKMVAANKVVLSKPGCAEKAGVGGAAKFFEHTGRAGTDTANNEEEIREEQRKKYAAKRAAKEKKEAEEKKKAAFAKRAGLFG